MTDRLGFVVLRCVRKPEHNQMWNHCCASINKVYPGSLIKVIDDHSTSDLVKQTDTLNNVEILSSDLSPGSGEVLPYYYYHKYGGDWFDRAVVLHDSAYVQHVFPTDCLTFRPLWHFPPKSHERWTLQCQMIEQCDVSIRSTVMDCMNDATRWNGCFGAMSVVSLAYLRSVVDLGSLHALAEHTSTRPQRMAFERVLPCIMSRNDGCPRDSCFGLIWDHPKAFGTKYKDISRKQYAKMPVVKGWCGR